MTVDNNKNTFEEKTLLKLEIFRECFREWYPVFLRNPYFDKVQVMDMFAGSGTDTDDNLGSPLIFLDEIKGKDSNFCLQADLTSRKIRFWFNEFEKPKAEELNQNVHSFIKECEKECSMNTCYFKNKIEITSQKFEDIFKSKEFVNIATDRKIAKFLVLDQYGFKEVGDDIFKRLIEYPSMDSIFYITTSAVRRFQEQDAVKKYFESNDINFDEENPKLAHRHMANYYRSLLPANKEFYVHHFSILKRSNRYGLIFCTNHTYGMEKFLEVCWRKDIYAGESDELINNDWTKDTLFSSIEPSQKKRMVKEDIQKQILNGNINDNKTGLKYSLKQGCLGDVYFEAVKELLDKEKISIDGKFNRIKKLIHRIKEKDIYKIKVSQ